MSLTIYDTLRRAKKPFEPHRPGKVGMYVCGLTVQAPPHVGHMRAYLVADVMRRVLRRRGFEVTLVQNFTDVDDKIIAKANEAGLDYREFAEQNIETYFQAADWMGIERADVYPRATDHIAEILEMISSLVDKGFAYAADGDVFFDVTTVKDYGKLSGKKIDELRSGARIAIDEAKKHPVDFALWKGAKPGEPAWDSPWGSGRPGWHIECSVMATKYLGATIDLHGGGRDLIFPHHENEIAQSESANECVFCNHWVENGMVNLAGEKMSKSTGHFFAVADVRQQVDPETLRLYLLSTHYRSPIDYSEERLREGRAALERIQNFLTAAGHAAGEGGGDPPEAADLEGTDAEVREALERGARGFEDALDDDFNSAGALGKVFELVRIGNSYLKEGETSPHQGGLLAGYRGRILDMMGALGFRLDAGAGPADEVPEAVRRLVEEREAARAAKDWGAADRLRDEIRAEGFVVEDRKEGSLIKPLDG